MVLRQKNVHEMHNLVLELDNNLSFGNSSSTSQGNADDNCGLMLSGPFKSIQMDASGLQFHDKNVIGKGTYATVYKCQLHGTDIAVKLFDSEAEEAGHLHITPEARILLLKTEWVVTFAILRRHKK